MFSQKGQISNYKQAVGKPAIGAKPSGQLMKKAESTSLGRNVKNRSTNISNGISTSRSSPKSRGSMAGYTHGASTHINMSGSGYGAKSQQVARQPRAPKDLRYFKAANYQQRNNMRSVTDYTRRGRPDSSKCRLDKIAQLNKLF